jgi:porphobilinogen synthase
MSFPATRMRRLRRTAALRRMVRETRLAVDQLVLPLFVVPGEGVERPVPSMPGVAQQSVDRILATCRETAELGIPAVLLFGIPDAKDAVGSCSWAPDGIVQQALGALRQDLPELVTIADVCFCEYTDHGHCGVLSPDGSVDNDATLENLARQAVSLARAGADVVAPSDMMDGRVGAIRGALDAAGCEQTVILAYAAKLASGFYGPFREAADSAPRSGDRRGYQMDPANSREAARELALDAAEGADILMVKPALPCLDLLHAARRRLPHPLAAYHVSGEYAMLRAAAAQGWLDYERCLMESLLAIRRAGADLIVTYGARDAARLLAAGWRE